MNDERTSMEGSIGPSRDLLIWIPKKEGADLPAGQRPLQLPSCLRRVFGGCLIGIVGPAIEPGFTRDQSAIKGGSCARNIGLAYQHLMLLSAQRRSKEQPMGQNPWRGRGPAATCATP